MSEKVNITDHSKEVLEALSNQAEAALEACGMLAEGYAKSKCPVDTGALRNSISYKVNMDEGAVYIGTNMEYAPYVELGTGEYVSGGRPTPWVYKDAKGNWHRTSGMKAQPYLKPAVKNHTKEYRDLVKQHLSK